MDPRLIHKVFSTVKWKHIAIAQAIVVTSYLKT